VVSQGAEFPRGLIWSRVGVNCDIKTQRMKVSARVGVRGDASEVVKWRVGLVQTILRLERRIVVVKGDSKGVFRTWLPGPCKDGPKDYAESWYDPGAVASLKLKQFQLVDVSMMDQPGFTWSQKVTETVEAVNGGEAFRTWLVMQRTDGSRTHFLRMWEWHVDYTISPDNINRFGIVFDGFQQNATGAGAVLDGLNGKNQFQNEFRQEHTNVTSFDELRRMAVQHN
jgi:hypothetical protein